eukprot:3961110-Prorocentrum_lima.AAC.1
MVFLLLLLVVGPVGRCILVAAFRLVFWGPAVFWVFVVRSGVGRRWFPLARSLVALLSSVVSR